MKIVQLSCIKAHSTNMPVNPIQLGEGATAESDQTNFDYFFGK